MEVEAVNELQCWVTLVLSIADELADQEQHKSIIMWAYLQIFRIITKGNLLEKSDHEADKELYKTVIIFWLQWNEQEK